MIKFLYGNLFEHKANIRVNTTSKYYKLHRCCRCRNRSAIPESLSFDECRIHTFMPAQSRLAWGPVYLGKQ